MAGPCGTFAGYHTHRRRGETPCDACKKAKAERTAVTRAASLAADGLTHGRCSTYDAGCRCEHCRTAKRIAYLTRPGEYQPKSGRRRIA